MIVRIYLLVTDVMLTAGAATYVRPRMRVAIRTFEVGVESCHDQFKRRDWQGGCCQERAGPCDISNDPSPFSEWNLLIKILTSQGVKPTLGDRLSRCMIRPCQCVFGRAGDRRVALCPSSTSDILFRSRSALGAWSMEHGALELELDHWL